jgi:hypothetical protein
MSPFGTDAKTEAARKAIAAEPQAPTSYKWGSPAAARKVQAHKAGHKMGEVGRTAVNQVKGRVADLVGIGPKTPAEAEGEAGAAEKQKKASHRGALAQGFKQAAANAWTRAEDVPTPEEIEEAMPLE